MADFDPHEYLLRNFSKHKFERFLENTVLDPSTNSELPELAQLDMTRWGSEGLAVLDVPTVLPVGVVSYQHRLYLLDHVLDGPIREDLAWQRAGERVAAMLAKFGEEADNLTRLRTVLFEWANEAVLASDPEQAPFFRQLQAYYLTNVHLDPYSDQQQYRDAAGTASDAWEEHVVDRAASLALDLSDSTFVFGVGSPRVFLTENRDGVVNAIEEIEARPDALHLQFAEGRLGVTGVNHRALFLKDAPSVQPVLLEQAIGRSSAFADIISEFEQLLNDPGTDERHIQAFLEAHPHFLLGSDYDEIRPQVSLVDLDERLLKPDFMLRPVERRLWDVLDIKLPAVPLVVGPKHRERLSHQVMAGIAQLTDYGRFFDDERNRTRLFRATGIDCFKPHLTLVIGNKANVDEAVWRRLLADERPYADIIGFDELITRAKRVSATLADNGRAGT